MNMRFRAHWRAAAYLSVWAAIVALRAVYTTEFEVLWWVGVIASLVAAAAFGWAVRGIAHNLKRRRRS